MSESPIDTQLIQRYIAGDKESLAILVKRWHKTFCKKAYWILKDKDLAKDVAQESWVIIIQKLPSLKKVESFKPWALRIIYTKSIDALKKKTKVQIMNEQHLNQIDKDVYDDSNEKEGKETLKIKMLDAIQDLSKDKQDIIRLFYLDEYSLKEISSFLQIPIGTVKSRLFKAREKLKSIIK